MVIQNAWRNLSTNGLPLDILKDQIILIQSHYCQEATGKYLSKEFNILSVFGVELLYKLLFQYGEPEILPKKRFSFFYEKFTRVPPLEFSKKLKTTCTSCDFWTGQRFPRIMALQSFLATNHAVNLRPLVWSQAGYDSVRIAPTSANQCLK